MNFAKFLNIFFTECLRANILRLALGLETSSRSYPKNMISLNNLNYDTQNIFQLRIPHLIQN